MSQKTEHPVKRWKIWEVRLRCGRGEAVKGKCKGASIFILKDVVTRYIHS